MENSSSRGEGVGRLPERGESSRRASSSDVYRNMVSDRPKQNLEKARFDEMKNRQKEADQSQSTANDFRKTVVKLLKEVNHLPDEELKKDAKELYRNLTDLVEKKKFSLYVEHLKKGEMQDVLKGYTSKNIKSHEEEIKRLTKELNPYYKNKIENVVYDAIMYQDLADREQQFANKAKSNIENGWFGECLTSYLDHYPTPDYQRFQSVPNLLGKVINDCFIGGPDEKKLQIMLNDGPVHPKEYTLQQRAEANNRASQANEQFLEQHGYGDQKPSVRSFSRKIRDLVLRFRDMKGK